jgi:hypothetical protein
LNRAEEFFFFCCGKWRYFHRLALFNTLAQIGTTATESVGSLNALLIRGAGTDLTNKEAIQRRGKCKFITQAIIRKLIDVAKEKEGAEKRVKAYWCQSRIFESGGRLYGAYCKNRFCTLCCGIRRAEIIDKYLPVIKTWAAPHFSHFNHSCGTAHQPA